MHMQLLGTGSSLSSPLKVQSCSRAGLCLEALPSPQWCGHGLCEKYALPVLHRVRCGFLWGLHGLKLKSSHSDKPSSWYLFLLLVLLHEASSISPSTNSVQWPKPTYAVFAGEQDRVSEAYYVAYTQNSNF